MVMKKVFTVMSVVALLFVATPSQAQKVQIGLKGGYNLMNMSLSSGASSVLDKSNRSGFFIGPAVRVGFPVPGLGADIAAVYDQRSCEIEGEKIKQKSINVPINLRYTIGLGEMAGFYLAAGPQFGFNVGDTDFTLKNGVTHDTSEYRLKKSSFSVNVGGGFVLIDNLEIGVTYNIALGKTADIAWGGVKDAYDTKNNAWQIHAAYYF